VNDPESKKLSYGSYLKVPELLALQQPLSSPAEHDELLFIVIHQVYELWFRQMIHEVEAVREAAKAGNSRRCGQIYRRLVEIQQVLLQQISVLETMTPVDFARFREHLNPASGFQSYQFRELEFMSGMKEPGLIRHLEHSPEAAKSLERRLAEPTLLDSLDDLLRQEGFTIPESGGNGATMEGAGPASAARLDAIHAVYRMPADHFDLYLLCEAMIEYDENFSLWRQRHILMVERMIGNKRGTGGTEGVRYLATTLGKRCFPELWEVRTRIGGGSW
jgi:tryptophan 2,3-dioxygenase